MLPQHKYTAILEIASLGFPQVFHSVVDYSRLHEKKMPYICVMEASKVTSLLNAALEYARCGFRVLPLAHKKPLIRDWVNQASSDENTIRSWFQVFSNQITGVGIAVDRNHVVVDFDPRNGGFHEDYELPETVTVVTGSDGRHYYYRMPDGIKSRKAKFGNGVDILGYGSFVVAPPSLHPNKNQYIFLSDCGLGEVEIAEAPAWVVEYLASDEQKAYKTKPPIMPGMRHRYLVSLAGLLMSAKIEDEVIKNILREVAEEHFVSLEDFDLEKEIENILKYGARWKTDSLTVRQVWELLPESVAAILAKYKSSELISSNDAGAQEQSKLTRIVQALAQAPVIRYADKLYWVAGNGLVHLDDAIVYLHKKEITASDPIIKNAIRIFLHDYKELHQETDALILDRPISFGRYEGLEGLWWHERYVLHCYDLNTGRIHKWEKDQWPKGIYRTPRFKGLSVDFDDNYTIEHLLRDWFFLTTRLQGKIWETLSFFAPFILGLADAGLWLYGGAGSGKSTFANILGYLMQDSEFATQGGVNDRDFAVAFSANHVVYFDEADSFLKTQTDKAKVKITGGTYSLRALYSDQENVNYKMRGTIITCITDLRKHIPYDLADRSFVLELENKTAFKSSDKLKEYAKNRAPKIRAALMRLLHEQYTCKDLYEYSKFEVYRNVEFRHWARYFATASGIPEACENYALNAKLLAHRCNHYSFIVDCLTGGKIEEGKPYRIQELGVLSGRFSSMTDPTLLSITSSLGRGESNRREIGKMAELFGYTVKFEKNYEYTQNKKIERLYIIFHKKPSQDYEVEDINENNTPEYAEALQSYRRGYRAGETEKGLVEINNGTIPPSSGLESEAAKVSLMEQIKQEAIELEMEIMERDERESLFLEEREKLAREIQLLRRRKGLWECLKYLTQYEQNASIYFHEDVFSKIKRDIEDYAKEYHKLLGLHSDEIDHNLCKFKNEVYEKECQALVGKSNGVLKLEWSEDERALLHAYIESENELRGINSGYSILCMYADLVNQHSIFNSLTGNLVRWIIQRAAYWRAQLLPPEPNGKQTDETMTIREETLLDELGDFPMLESDWPTDTLTESAETGELHEDLFSESDTEQAQTNEQDEWEESYKEFSKKLMDDINTIRKQQGLWECMKYLVEYEDFIKKEWPEGLVNKMMRDLNSYAEKFSYLLGLRSEKIEHNMYVFEDGEYEEKCKSLVGKSDGTLKLAWNESERAFLLSFVETEKEIQGKLQGEKGIYTILCFYADLLNINRVDCALTENLILWIIQRSAYWRGKLNPPKPPKPKLPTPPSPKGLPTPLPTTPPPPPPPPSATQVSQSEPQLSVPSVLLSAMSIIAKSNAILREEGEYAKLRYLRELLKDHPEGEVRKMIVRSIEQSEMLLGLRPPPNDAARTFDFLQIRNARYEAMAVRLEGQTRGDYNADWTDGELAVLNTIKTEVQLIQSHYGAKAALHLLTRFLNYALEKDIYSEEVRTWIVHNIAFYRFILKQNQDW